MMTIDKLIVIAGAALFIAVLVSHCDAQAGPYVESGAFWHNTNYDDMGDTGHILLSLAVGMAFDSGFVIEAEHISDPDKHDTGINKIGGGFRYEW